MLKDFLILIFSFFCDLLIILNHKKFFYKIILIIIIYIRKPLIPFFIISVGPLSQLLDNTIFLENIASKITNPGSSQFEVNTKKSDEFKKGYIFS